MTCVFSGECLWLHLDLIKGMLNFCKGLFPVTDYAFTTIPTYPSGQIGFVLCSKNPVSILYIDKWIQHMLSFTFFIRYLIQNFLSCQPYCVSSDYKVSLTINPLSPINSKFL